MEITYLVLDNLGVKLTTTNCEIITYIEKEIGGFYKFVDFFPEKSILLGEVIFFNRTPKNLEDIVKEAKLDTKIILHNGSHKDDLRIGRMGVYKHYRIILSDTTGTFFIIEDDTKIVYLINENLEKGAKDARRIIRDQMFTKYMESRGALVFHGACFSFRGDGYLILGQSGSGKTSTFIAAMKAKKKFEFLSCERIIIKKELSRIKAFASPETITIFPGTLRSFEEISNLAKYSKDLDKQYERQNKVRIDWRDLFKAFNVYPPETDVVLRSIFVPVYNPIITNIKVTSILNPMNVLTENLLTTRDKNRPDFLSWYPCFLNSEVVLALEKIKIHKLEWQSIHHLVNFFEEVEL